MQLITIALLVAAAPRPIGSLPDHRAYPAIALLKDDRVLVVGGAYWDKADGYKGKISAELMAIDTTTGAITQLTPMPRPRYKHNTITLQDGRVLISGGTREEYAAVDHKAIAEAEIFDPKTGKHTDIAPMREPRREHDAIVLQDGRVLIVGGRENGNLHRGAELFDPKTGAWTDTLWRGRFNPALVLLGDGRVLAAGGNIYGVGAMDVADIFDPKTNVWTALPAMPEKRWYDVATKLRDGRVLIAGGSGYISAPAHSVIFDPAKNTWSNADATPEDSRSPALVSLKDGRPMFCATQCWAYTKTWTPLFDITSRRQDGRGVLRRGDGAILFVEPGKDVLLYE